MSIILIVMTWFSLGKISTITSYAQVPRSVCGAGILHISSVSCVASGYLFACQKHQVGHMIGCVVDYHNMFLFGLRNCNRQLLNILTRLWPHVDEKQEDISLRYYYK